MPLVRAEVRNEFALGAPELYREAKKEEPKEVLEGVAVAGLVGVLRQLGDLAEFAAEVFHGLQEEVTITTARSHKLMTRVRRIEAALSPLEKALLAQSSHLHFAYTPGSNWQSRIRCEKNHFIYSDVPQFIMESYEDCRHPPCLHMLDRFDAGGPGSCLKRYSNPAFFKSASVAAGEASIEKIPKEKRKGRKTKKRRSWPRNGDVSRDASFSYNSGRMPFTQRSIGGHTSPSQTASTYDATLKSDSREQSNLDLRNGSGYIEGDFRRSYSVEPESRDSISSAVKKNDSDFLDYNFIAEKATDVYDGIEIGTQDQAGCSSSSVTWEEKRESFEPTLHESDNDNQNRDLESFSLNLDMEIAEKGPDSDTIDKMDTQPCNIAQREPEYGNLRLDDVESETDNFMDALNTIESECETDVDNARKQLVEHHSQSGEKEEDDEAYENKRLDLEWESSYHESNILASSSPINGSHSFDSLPRNSSYAADFINETSPEGDGNSLSLMDKSFSDSHGDDNINSGNYVEHVPSIVSSSFRECRPATESKDHGAFELNGHNSDFQSSSPENNIVANSPVVNGVHEHTLISTSPNSIHETDGFTNTALHDGKVDSIFENISNSHDNGNIDGSNSVESVVTNPSSNLGDPKPELVTDGVRESLQSYKNEPDITNIAPVTFWTNGGLLGLMPSKPPDGIIVNSLPPNSSIQDINPCGRDSSKLNQLEASGTRSTIEELETDTSSHEEESGTTFKKPSWKISPADLEIDLEKLGHLDNWKSTGPIAAAPPTLVATKNADDFELKNRRSIEHRTFSGRSKDLFSGKSPLLSPSSSPPLEHMKISFQPINGYESSKLKLKFPDGKSSNGSGSDIYPSFQLVPEVSIPRYNVGSDSDADTFYRSSPSLSDDDCESNQSESNSEQWESSESPTSKDPDLYDALRRISLTESENGKTNGVQNSESCRSFDLQSLSTVNNSFRKELINDNVKPNLLPSTALPPLPPSEWRGMVPIKDNSNAIPEGSYFGLTRSASTISQPKPAPFNEDQIVTRSVQKSKQPVLRKSNGQREASEGKGTDENDFLHQIRTKSFNLRPTMTARSTAPSGIPTTAPVNAILEKANAIRQAVASDAEDDGNWSDT